jgi:hypothetical protein
MLTLVGTIVGIVAGVLVILGWITERGRQARRWLFTRIRRRPVAPRTNVHIEPQRHSGWWSQISPPDHQPNYLVSFQMRCLATNLTPRTTCGSSM